jgi:hypothetical protein
MHNLTTIPKVLDVIDSMIRFWYQGWSFRILQEFAYSTPPAHGVDPALLCASSSRIRHVTLYTFARKWTIIFGMDTLSSALTVLTAMLAPAVLLSACGTLILSTSNRLGRVVDRVRTLSDRFEDLTHEEVTDPLAQKKLTLIFHQLARLTRRARLLQGSLTSFYLAVGILIATSVAIGVVALTNSQYGWIPVVLGLASAGFLFYGSLLLILEARLALQSTYEEMQVLWEMGQHYAPAELLEEYQAESKGVGVVPRFDPRKRT